jgi:tetratricopeptide (TPR) repeat protein
MSISGEKGGAVRKGARGAAALAIVVGVGMSSAACAKIGELKAMMRFKEANVAYQGQNYPRAIELYEETLANNPNMTQVHFFLGNSYDNTYLPGSDDPANRAKLDKAIEQYTLGGENIPDDTPENKKLKILSLQYLAATYGSDKLDDPAKAEPVIQELIRLDPAEPGNYVQLAKLYQDAGVYDEAEKMYVYATQARPSDTGALMQLAGFYNSMGQFDKTIEALQKRADLEPNNPEAYFTISTYYWDNAQRNVQLRRAEKLENVTKGLEAVNKAIEIRPDYMEALTYKGLLLRTEANLETDPAKQQALLKEAVQLQNEAEELRKKKAAGVSG